MVCLSKSFSAPVPLTDLTAGSMHNSLSSHLSAWHKIDSPVHVIDWIQHGIQIPFVSQPKPFVLQNRLCNSKESAFIDAEVSRLLLLDCVEEVNQQPLFLNPIKCVPKKNNKLRLITDLRVLNSHCDVASYKNEDIRTVAEFVQPDDYMISVDLKDGFLHVPVSEEHRQYLSFQWNGHYYQWKVLPFGLCCSPYYFCKTLRPIVAFLRTWGIRLTVYVDDFYLCAQRKNIVSHRDMLLETLTDLGLRVNADKSHLQPTQTIEHIGYNVSSVSDSGRPVISVVARRLQTLRHDVRRLLNKGQCTARGLARITGQCVSMAWAITPGKLLLRASYRLLSTRTGWESTLQVTTEVREELVWWLHAATSWNVYEVAPTVIDLQIATDASHLGYGGCVVGTELYTSGEWNKRVSVQSSNYRELLAILMTLLAFKDSVRGKVVELLSDNITAVAYVKYKGGPCADLTQVAKAIWATALDIGASLVCRHIAGKDNVMADLLSRTPDKHDWMLHPQLFKFIDHMWGPHTVDRFASLKSTQLQRFNSRFFEAGSEGVDALAQQNWGHENNWVNPPFCLLTSVLDIVKRQGATATVIAPRWPAQPWYHTLQELSVTLPIKIPNQARAFRHMGVFVPEPRRNRRWQIYAWRIFGGIT